MFRIRGSKRNTVCKPQIPLHGNFGNQNRESGYRDFQHLFGYLNKGGFKGATIARMTAPKRQTDRIPNGE